MMKRLDHTDVPAHASADAEDDDMIWSDMPWPLLDEVSRVDADSTAPTLPIARTRTRTVSIDALRRAG